MEGITFMGSLIVDVIKMIDSYPPEGSLCNMHGISRCVGGLAANTPIGLKVLDPAFDVRVAGLVGDDAEGRYLVDTISSYGIDGSAIGTHPSLPTSFTDVMTVTGTGTRTFFQQQGACRAFSYESIAFDKIATPHVHLGYALLLDGMDAPDSAYGTVMAKTLARLKAQGISTSIDVVSEHSDRYQTVIGPALRYTDYLFMNETEAGATTGIAARDEAGTLLEDNLPRICAALLERGVGKMVVLHAPESGWATAGGALTAVPSLKLPPGYIQGTVGAGDAFCAGMLYAIQKGWGPEQGLRLASAAAAANLSQSNSVDGMRPLADLLELGRRYGS